MNTRKCSIHDIRLLSADSLVATRIEEKDEKMFVESGNEEDEDDLAEAIERSMILDERYGRWKRESRTDKEV